MAGLIKAVLCCGILKPAHAKVEDLECKHLHCIMG